MKAEHSLEPLLCIILIIIKIEITNKYIWVNIETEKQTEFISFY